MDTKVVDKWLELYPVLADFITAGTIGLKAAREILGVDRYFMYEIYKELLVAGAIVSCGTNAWRATPELKEYIAKRRASVDK